jgi:hypothetical protein
MELNILAFSSSYKKDVGIARMPSKNDRVELEMKILKYRALARQAPDDKTTERIKALVIELEQKLREIDE